MRGVGGDGVVPASEVETEPSVAALAQPIDDDGAGALGMRG